MHTHKISGIILARYEPEVFFTLCCRKKNVSLQTQEKNTAEILTARFKCNTYLRMQPNLGYIHETRVTWVGGFCACYFLNQFKVVLGIQMDQPTFFCPKIIKLKTTGKTNGN